MSYQIQKLEKEISRLRAEIKYLQRCCEDVGNELAKYGFEYDHKEKNLVVQAKEINEKYEQLVKELESYNDNSKETA